MLDADLRGKLPKKVSSMEDVLTSHFFGIMRSLPPETLLLPWLRRAGVDAVPLLEAGKRPSYFFWPSLPNGVEPDMVIRLGDLLVVVEVKYLSPLDGGSRAQLEREVDGGLQAAKKEGRRLVFVVLSNDREMPRAVVDLLERGRPPERFGYRLAWVSWRDTSEVVERSAMAERGGRAETLWKLLEALEARGLRGFRGLCSVEEKWGTSCEKAVGVLSRAMLEVAAMFQALDSVLAELGFSPLSLQGSLIRDGLSQSLDEPRSWLPTRLGRFYRKTRGECDPQDALYFSLVEFSPDRPPSATVGGMIRRDRRSGRPVEPKEAKRALFDGARGSEEGLLVVQLPPLPLRELEGAEGIERLASSLVLAREEVRKAALRPSGG